MYRHAVPAVPDLVTALSDDTADVRAAAALAIHFSDAQDPNLAASLRPRLADPDARVRVAIAATLMRLDSLAAAEALPILSHGLMHPEEQYSNLAGWSLAELGAAAAPALPALRAAIFSRDPPNEGALDVLAKLGDLGVPVLAEALSHAQPSTRQTAAYFLGTLGATARPAVPALEAARHDPEERVRRAATEALQRIESPSTLE
jgi:HEAT repeat protein